MVEPTVIGTRRDLGVQLAELRAASRLTQTALAKQLGYSRSTVANVEAGRQSVCREFWEGCDRILRCDSILISAYSALEELIRRGHREAAESVHRARSAMADQWRDEHRTAQAPVGADTAMESTTDQNALLAIHRTFVDTVTGPADVTERADLESLVVDAFRRQDSGHPLSVALIGGFAGSGKSEFARFLSGVTGWTILDKDTITRSLVEALLSALGADVNDRHSATYQTQARPHEYRCLLDAAGENLSCGVSTVLTAPFLREFADPAWLKRTENMCARFGAKMCVVWVKCDVESMHDYLRYRGAARDSWKLTNWDEYLATIDPDFAPDFPHYTVDNNLNAAVALVDQAREVASRMRSGV